jgi:hypothetical protein
MYVALKTMAVDGHPVAPGQVLPDCAGGWSPAQLVRMHLCGHVARVKDGHEAEFAAALRRGEMPMKLAPQSHVSDLALARMRMLGTDEPTGPKARKVPRKQH